jgi:UPF0176 protein
MEYQVLAYYLFTQVDDPAADVFRHKGFFLNRDVRGRIYVSKEGINGQMSASPQAAGEYVEWLKSDPRFHEVEFKIHTWHEHCFPRMTVKVRPQLVALDAPVDMSKIGVRLAPEEWKKMLDERDENTLLIDVRNDYEWNIGHFEGAELPKLEQFRQFPEYARSLKAQRDPSKTKVMMYCTGGIRCELYSAFMKDEGFTEVYQLDGGVIKYGLQSGSRHWRGKLFVFDDRLSVPISDQQPADIIGQCVHCQCPTDLYFNCANVDCNNLFLSCLQCGEKRRGCCCGACEEAPRVRAFTRQDRPKPFRRMNCGTSV